MLELYKLLYMIRRCEESVQKYYNQDKMKTPMHMSMGGEAAVAGVCFALNSDDQVFGTYRSHALYLAKTLDTDGFFAEMYGKKNGCAQGKAGSMHLANVGKGHMGSSAVVATNIPVAVGCALANKYQGNNKVVATFFGEGACDEGAFWESVNFASCNDIPVLFVCEDNGLAVHTLKKSRQGYDCIDDVIGKFNCNVFHTDSTDADEVCSEAKKAVDMIRNTGRPSFLRVEYFRYLEHVGINEDFDAGYRSRDESWLDRDPVDLYRKKLITQGALEVDIKNMEQDIDSQIDKSVYFADSSDYSNVSSAYEDVYV